MNTPSPTPVARRHGSTLSLILTIVFVSIGAIVGGIATQYVIDLVRVRTIHAQLVQVSENLNRTTPKMVDKLTRLDGTTVTDGDTLRYRYTLISLRTAQLNAPKFISLMRASILATYRTNPDMATFREEKVSLGYEYFDEDGKPIADIAVGPQDLR